MSTVRQPAPPADGALDPSGGLFERFGGADVRDLISEYPLAWILPRDGEVREASLLPLLGEFDAQGRLTDIVGHMGRRNPLFAALSNDPRAVVLFRGPESYVSPEHAGKRDWAPTWNYAQLRIEAEVEFMPEETGAAVARLVEAMEAPRAAPWRSEELGDRYAQMERAIIGFRARVTRLTGRFKLGQDETPETLKTIIANLPDAAMARWMRRFNAERI